MSNKRQIVVKKIANICCKNQNRIATQLLLNAIKNQQIKKKIQRRICQLKINYCCRAFNLSFAISTFYLLLFNSSSSSFNSFSSFNSSFSFDFSSSSSSFSSFNFSSSSSSSSFDLFVFVLLTKDLLTRDLSIN
jgi:hypothetical protein